MNGKDQFHQDFDDTQKFPEPPAHWKLSSERWYAMLGAKWAAEICAEKVLVNFGLSVNERIEHYEKINAFAKEIAP